MNQNNFNDLKALIGGMTKGEKSTAKKFLVAFDSNVTKNKNKGAALFRFLMDKPHASIEKAKKVISANVDDRSFDRQVIRLKEKLLESLLLDINITKPEVYSDWYATRMDLRKKYMQAFAIFSRGLHKESFRLLGKVLEKAEEYELYAEKVEALYFLQQSLGLRNGQKEFNQYNDQLEHATLCRDAVVVAEDYYYRHFIFDVDSSGLKNEKVSALTQYISELQEHYERTKSANVGFFLFLLMMEYYRAMDDYESTRQTGFKLVDLIEGSKAIYMPRRLANAYGDISAVELYLYDFEAVIKHSKIAQTLDGDIIYNYLIDLEVEFFARFYLNELNNAHDLVEELLEKTDSEETPFNYDRRLYLKACVQFCEAKFRDSYMTLQDAREIEGDKEGWNIGIRILNIMNLMELNLFDLVDNQIEALRKHIERYKDRPDREVRRREELILRLLTKLEKSSYDFAGLAEREAHLIDELDRNDKGIRWEPKTYEMIVFQDWFRAKVNKELYYFELPASAVEERSREKEIAPEILAYMK